MEFFGVAGLLVILFLLMARQRQLRDVRGHALAQLAAHRDGWDFDGHTLRGRVADATVTLSTSQASYDQAWSVVVEPDVPWSPALVGAHPTEGETLRTGHAGFDAEVAVVGRAVDVLPVLNGTARGAIRKAVDAGFRWDGQAWRFHNVQLTAERQLLQTALVLACDLALHVRPVADPDAALEEGLRTEPHPAVRAALLGARLERATPLPRDLLHELLAPRDWGSLLVARHVRDMDWLFELAHHGIDADTRWDAVLAVSDQGEDPRLAAALAAFVIDTPWSGEAIDRLAEVGTVAEVPVLRQVADSWLDVHRSEAQAAIRAIQARSRGSVGQLSLAETRSEKGALSVAERERRSTRREEPG